MSPETIVYIVIAGFIALFLALFLYSYNVKNQLKLKPVFIFLRFLTIFSILLLLINPQFEHINYYTEKPNLIVAIDNSSSIKYLNQDQHTRKFIEEITNNKDLKSKFNIETYTFGNSLKASDSVDFSEKETNIANIFKQLSQVYNNNISPLLLITDGNQTFGNDYTFVASSYKQPIYPIILGDTITYTDVSIQQLNVNKYAFLKNKFPVECILVYNGHKAIKTRFEVYSGKNLVFSEPVTFSKKNNSKILNFTLPASRIGVISYKATVVPIENEKNRVNNTKSFAVEVIDQKTNVAIVSDFYHPDLGALKESIASNQQHQVSILKPEEVINQINDFQLFILYQPNQKFKKLIDLLDDEKKNRWTILGTKTDLNFLNTINKNYKHDITHQVEDYLAELNTSYAPFIIKDIHFESFPPLKSNFGSVTFSVPFETLLFKTINNNKTDQPLFATFELNGKREAVLFGENIWQWRAQSFLNDNSFTDFDDFISSIIQYLASNKRKTRLNVSYESFYNENNNLNIKAEFFDKNYIFDPRATLNITLKDSFSKVEKSIPFVLKNNMYQVDLSNLAPSDYRFTVTVGNGNISKSGSFKILDYNVEQQFLNANVTKLEQLATYSKGAGYFITNTDSFVSDILTDNRYKSVQKEKINTVPLIDWKYLLFLIVCSLAIEWFLRKFNGLI